MPETPTQPHLTVVGAGMSGILPPRNLGAPGLALWHRVQSEFRIEDVGGQELLLQACEASDRVSSLAAQIARDGEMIHTRNGPRAHPFLREELSCRMFICRTLQRIGITLEPLRPGPGHPPKKW